MSEQKLEKITEKILLADLFKDEGAVQILEEYGFPCIGCQHLKNELGFLSLESVSVGYGLDVKDMIKDLNSYLDNRELYEMEGILKKNEDKEKS
ncbi:hypothetical protein HZA33_00110 [Candidatus Pacearchaeota archaeon]|nr:hypothetical protein [Candidatus Pacearchaeota archaeon]